MMYRFSPSAYASNAIREDRLGSYSIVVTVAGIPVLSRLKSMMRSLRLWPPPMNRIVMSPELRRPPVRGLGSIKGLCGCLVVMSSLTIVVRYRSVCVVGLYVLIGINQLFNLLVIPSALFLARGICFSPRLQILGVLRHLLAGPQPHVRLLPIRTVARELPAPPLFPRICRSEEHTSELQS